MAASGKRLGSPGCRHSRSLRTTSRKWGVGIRKLHGLSRTHLLTFSSEGGESMTVRLKGKTPIGPKGPVYRLVVTRLHKSVRRNPRIASRTDYRRRQQSAHADAVVPCDMERVPAMCRNVFRHRRRKPAQTEIVADPSGDLCSQAGWKSARRCIRRKELTVERSNTGRRDTLSLTKDWQPECIGRSGQKHRSRQTARFATGSDLVVIVLGLAILRWEAENRKSSVRKDLLCYFAERDLAVSQRRWLIGKAYQQQGKRAHGAHDALFGKAQSLIIDPHSASCDTIQTLYAMRILYNAAFERHHWSLSSPEEMALSLRDD